MIDAATLQRWFEDLGYDLSPHGKKKNTFHLRRKGAARAASRPAGSAEQPGSTPPSSRPSSASPPSASPPSTSPPSASPPSSRAHRPFYLQHSEHWVLLSMLPMLGPNDLRPDDLSRRLLAQNREMRVAKYALDKNGEVVLCAELPTESLDFAELADAVEKMRQYAADFDHEIRG